MEYYAVHVWTGKEDEFAQRLSKLELFEGMVFVPKRTLSIRRAGKIKKIERPIFGGYVFLGIDSDGLTNEQRWALRRSNNFMRILPSTLSPQPIGEQDCRLIAHFMSFGKAADVSKVMFDDNDRIVVLEGALKGLEGSIVRVDRRKRRAKVQLDMCMNSFSIDLAFEVIAKPEKEVHNPS